jgi:hypothetical protein
MCAVNKRESAHLFYVRSWKGTPGRTRFYSQFHDIAKLHPLRWGRSARNHHADIGSVKQYLIQRRLCVGYTFRKGQRKRNNQHLYLQMVTSLRPLGVNSYSVTSSSTIFTYSSKPRNVPTISFSLCAKRENDLMSAWHTVAKTRLPASHLHYHPNSVTDTLVNQSQWLQSKSRHLCKK